MISLNELKLDTCQTREKDNEGNMLIADDDLSNLLDLAFKAGEESMGKRCLEAVEEISHPKLTCCDNQECHSPWAFDEALKAIKNVVKK